MINKPQSVHLTERGLSAEVAYETAKRLIEQWDGTRTLKEIYEAELASDAAILEAKEIE